jgi:hypothetical protein
MRVVENFQEFLDLARINQGPDGWSIYGANPKKKKKSSTRHRLARLHLKKRVEDLLSHTPN